MTSKKRIRKEMKICNAITNKGERCKKRKLFLSSYCIYHQDKANFINLLYFIVGIIITCVFFILANKEPVLEVKAELIDNNYPGAIKLYVINQGNKEAKDVYINFNGTLPIGTEIFSNPDFNLKYIESDVLDNPNNFKSAVKINSAFSIFIPRIPSEDTIDFIIKTIDDDNIRAAYQVNRIQNEKNVVVGLFIENVLKRYPKYKKRCSFELEKNHQIKNNCFYSPSTFVYENGRYNVDFITEPEYVNSKYFSDIYKNHKKEFINTFQSNYEFHAPVVKLKTNEGVVNLAKFPAFVDTHIDSFFVINSDSTKESIRLELVPKIPAKY